MTASAIDRASERLIAAVLDPTVGHLYPDGTVFVGRDVPSFENVVRDALFAEGRPVAVIDQGGDEVLIVPEPRFRPLRWLLRPRFRIEVRAGAGQRRVVARGARLRATAPLPL